MSECGFRTKLRLFHCDHYLAQPVQWEPTENNIGEELEDTEGGKHNPVGQPASVIIFVRTFNGLEAENGQ